MIMVLALILIVFIAFALFVVFSTTGKDDIQISDNPSGRAGNSFDVSNDKDTLEDNDGGNHLNEKETEIQN